MERNLIQVKENEIVTTSLLVAEKFNKNHKDVLRKIDGLILEIETGAKLRPLNYFEKSEYVDSHNQSRIMYYINRDGFTLLAMSFTGREALAWKLKYIEAFNEMERRLNGSSIPDNRLDIARLLVRAPKTSVEAIKELYPEYFIQEIKRGSLECISEKNTSYRKWIEDYNITSDWIGDFPTTDIYNNYMRYCNENRMIGIGKKKFFSILEEDFNLTKKQRKDGRRYFISA